VSLDKITRRLTEKEKKRERERERERERGREGERREGKRWFLVGRVLLTPQGKYNDKERRVREGKGGGGLRVAQRGRLSLNLHFQHFARRQITTSLRRSSDINDIFDLASSSSSTFPVSFIPLLVVIFAPSPASSSARPADDNATSEYLCSVGRSVPLMRRGLFYDR